MKNFLKFIALFTLITIAVHGIAGFLFGINMITLSALICASISAYIVRVLVK